MQIQLLKIDGDEVHTHEVGDGTFPYEAVLWRGSVFTMSHESSEAIVFTEAIAYRLPDGEEDGMEGMEGMEGMD